MSFYGMKNMRNNFDCQLVGIDTHYENKHLSIFIGEFLDYVGWGYKTLPMWAALLHRSGYGNKSKGEKVASTISSASTMQLLLHGPDTMLSLMWWTGATNYELKLTFPSFWFFFCQWFCQSDNKIEHKELYLVDVHK